MNCQTEFPLNLKIRQPLHLFYRCKFCSFFFHLRSEFFNTFVIITEIWIDLLKAGNYETDCWKITSSCSRNSKMYNFEVPVR